MRYVALATDYDGTLAHHGKVDELTVRALERLRESGRRLIMVTGRELEELIEVCPCLGLFDRVVAENGALLYHPATREEKPLGKRPPDAFVAQLRSRGAERISQGRVIVATWEPAQHAALEVIHELGLELQVTFNKGAVMILPSGINKAFGLTAALNELKLSPHNVVAIGDAENDHALFDLCECSAAVSNALPALKAHADLVTVEERGAGVVEVIDQMIKDDLASIASRLSRHRIPLGHLLNEKSAVQEVEPYGRNILVAGTSGSGKSTLTTGLMERLADRDYQYILIDPEGDYFALEQAVVLGDPHRAPLMEEILGLAKNPKENVAVNMLGIALEHRPAFFADLLPRLHELRACTGRPHWIVVDEAHHLMPSTRDPATLKIAERPVGMLLITVHPESIAIDVLRFIDVLLAVGLDPAGTIRSFAEALNESPPDLHPVELGPGEALLWRRGRETAIASEIVHIKTERPKLEHIRHSRKYAEGNVGADRAFQFRGPEAKLHLKAQNLTVFMQMAEGVDDDTWLHHLCQGDYSNWFRKVIKDEELADEACRIEDQRDLAPTASRRAFRQAIEQRYTLPADSASGETSED